MSAPAVSMNERPMTPAEELAHAAVLAAFALIAPDAVLR